MKSILRLFLLTAVAVIPASAGIISIAFDNPDQIGLPGETLSFYAVITHVGTGGDPDLYLNSDSLDLTMPGGFVLDNFFANVPISLAPGESSALIDLFDVTLPNDPGPYAGAYQLLGGADGGTFTAADNLAQANFSVTVAPEPGTLALFGAGFAIVLWRSKRSDRAHGQPRN
jgi:hypothetical protein